MPFYITILYSVAIINILRIFTYPDFIMFAEGFLISIGLFTIGKILDDFENNKP